MVSTSVATFTNALDLFRQGASAVAVHAALSKYIKFKVALPPQPKPEFVMPAPKNPSSILQKRQAAPTPMTQASPPKRQKQGSLDSMFKKSCTINSPKLEEEKTAEACLSNHGSAIVAIAGVSLSSCSMSGGFH
jgi:hypothetical protein